MLVNREGFITMISERYARFLGYSSSKEIVGKHVTEVIENTRMHIVARSGIPEHYDVQKIGNHKIVCSRIPIYQDGEVVGAFGKMIFKDVTEMEHILARVKLLEDRLKDYQKELSRLRLERYRFENLIGVSGKFRRAIQMAKKAANNDLNVLIVGEPGTGKGLFAHAIHANGKGNRFPIVTVNCAEGINWKDIRSQLVLASGGTVFLKRIDELDVASQVRFLEALKEGASNGEGGDRSLRVIATSVEEPEDLVTKGKLRPELFYFISEVLIHLPPLRDRKEDIPLLADYFLSEISFKSGKGGKTFTSQAMEMFVNYPWPGNIIELRSAVKYAFSLSEGRYILTDHLPSKILEGSHQDPKKENLYLMREDAEKRVILETLYQCNRNVTEAARRLGIHRTTLHRKLKRLGLK
ncbi:MAG TPA: sigma-54-dependent Fis family transcriptional regulator [Thermosulfidibacter takaii]|uniref:Sigma-54-dependent Fis family transcriptional regulator n=1 Tax=Thermosulfidibacter takaii TaxID=412593 RepID=A0A7C0Y8X4_9BACT|nr:sigma-54-dependent Fis family transcriptional regulator [Thermosulfidibacter takaii]